MSSANNTGKKVKARDERRGDQTRNSTQWINAENGGSRWTQQ